ncbi:MAG TPA: cellulase family glycosylhydrolase [Candidatus Kryptonia bacterium]
MNSFYKFSLISVLVFAPLTQVCSQGFLNVSGQKIVDQSGNEIHFRGMGIGGWLEPEGYMFLMSGFANSPTEIHNAIQNLIGVDSTNEFYNIFHSDFVTESDISALHDWGFNLVRLPFHYNILSPVDSPGVYIPGGFALLDSVISWCGKYGMYVILDMHCAPGSQNSDNIGDYNSSVPSLWQDTSKQSRTVDIWKTIAERYRNETAVAGYDLLNEPHWDFGAGSNNAPLRNLYVRITSAVRAVDTNHIVYIEGNTYATDFSGLTPPWDNKMVYSFHKYWNTNDAPSIQGYLNIRSTYNVPLWLGESGENSNSWYTDCIALMNQYDIGWSWWTLKKFNTTTSPLNTPTTSDYQQLLNYWQGSASKPSVAFATAALLKMADKLKFENCIYLKDVTDALMRQPTDNGTSPFALDTIPGTIYADNYDLGRIGYAYNDADYQNNGGSSTTWNQGGSYRNDGVDIEPCADPASNGYDVGWIQNGEWMLYTIDVKRQGIYNIDVRYASNQSGGQFILRLDGNVVTTSVVNVPVTGGWQTWQTLTVPGITLYSGLHIFKIQFFAGGFNLNNFTFNFVSTPVKSRNDDVFTFKLEQNYPNPFNPSTAINYQLSAVSYVTLKVFDAIGREVKTLVAGRENPGNHSITFNSANLPSGVYFYRLAADRSVMTKSMLLLK